MKNTESEEVLEKFIDKYKVGSNVELAQKRLKVAKAWTPIKNTIDPHTLSGFLSDYHDPIFETLAQNSLQRLDDQAWQVSLNAGTGDAFEAYVKIWSAVRPTGRHVEEAKNRLNELNERTYWELYDNDPEAISTMYLLTEGNTVKFYYERPSKYIQALVKRDTLKFEGTKNGQWYQGKAYVFTKYCGRKSIGYDMSGNENDDHTLITLRGPAPVFEKETCRVHHFSWDSKNSTLEFKAQTSIEREITVKTKQSDKNNHIH